MRCALQFVCELLQKPHVVAAWIKRRPIAVLSPPPVMPAVPTRVFQELLHFHDAGQPLPLIAGSLRFAFPAGFLLRLRLLGGPDEVLEVFRTVAARVEDAPPMGSAMLLPRLIYLWVALEPLHLVDDVRRNPTTAVEAAWCGWLRALSKPAP